jgi:hypothetical protein
VLKTPVKQASFLWYGQNNLIHHLVLTSSVSTTPFLPKGISNNVWGVANFELSFVCYLFDGKKLVRNKRVEKTGPSETPN